MRVRNTLRRVKMHPMQRQLIVVDADVLGRQRTGDETYVLNLLRSFPAVAPDLRIAAVTRHPELVPEGIEPVHLPAQSQEWRMAWQMPQLLRRLQPALAHFQYSLPFACPCPAVITVHDLSFERSPALMGTADRLIFRTMVPRSVRRSRFVLTVSERSRADLMELYGVDPSRIVVTPNGVDPAYHPNGQTRGKGYLLFVGAIQPRKNPLAALAAAEFAGLPLVMVGPVKDTELAAELERRGASLRGYVTKEELASLYRGAEALLFPSEYEGFGLPILEAMASGTPVVATPDLALREVAGDAALYAPPSELGATVKRALADRARLSAAGLERVKLFSWEETARKTADTYRKAMQMESVFNSGR